MNWDMVAPMVAVSAAVSSLMAFVVSLMIRSAIAEAAASIKTELHGLLEDKYVRRDVYERDREELKQGIAWIEGLIGKG